MNAQMFMQTDRLLALSLCSLLLIGACGGQGADKKKAPSPLAVQQQAEVERTLLYPAADDMLLTGLVVQLPEGKTAEDKMIAVVKRYIEGPAGENQMDPFPENCRLRALFLRNGSNVVLDLSGPVNQGGGSDTEIARVYGLIDTLAWNFRAVKSVKLLVNGSEVNTLLGHLDLRHSLPPEPKLLAPQLLEQWQGETNEVAGGTNE